MISSAGKQRHPFQILKAYCKIEEMYVYKTVETLRSRNPILRFNIKEI